MNEPPDPPGSGHSFGSGHPHSQTGRGRLVPSHDKGRHQLDQHRLRELYPVIPAGLISQELRMLHPVRYMPPHGAYYDLHDKERVQFPYPVKKSCKVCMNRKHVDIGQPCYETCLACGRTHPLAVSEPPRFSTSLTSQPCPQIYNTVRSWRRFGWRMDDGEFGVPASTQVKPNEDEVVMLKANGYVAQDWVYNAKQTPVFLDGEWNRERRRLNPSVSVPYPRTSSLSARISYGHNTYRNGQNTYGNDTYRDDTHGNDQNAHRNDRRSPPRRDTYDEQYQSRSRGHGRDHRGPRRSRSRSPSRDMYRRRSRSPYRSSRDHRRSRRSRSPPSGRDYRDRSPARNESPNFVDLVVQGVMKGLFAQHNDKNRRERAARPQNTTFNRADQWERAASFATDRQARPALSQSTAFNRSDRWERAALPPAFTPGSHRQDMSRPQTQQTAGALGPVSRTTQQEHLTLSRNTDPSARNDGDIDLEYR
jgi:hypothetical protein